jgi:hypothetical protein
MWITFSNRKTTNQPLKPATLYRRLPQEWQQTSEERETWHSFRVEQSKRRESQTPLTRIDFTLTGAGQTA